MITHKINVNHLNLSKGNISDMKESNNQYKETIATDLLNISIPEILIIQHLERFIGTIVRFQLYQEFNDSNKLGYNFTPMKFYKSLDRLEKIGVIAYHDGKRPKSKEIQITSKAKYILNQINKITILNSFSALNSIENIFNQVMDFYNLSDFKTSLIIDCQSLDRLDTSKIKLIAKYSNTTHLVVNSDVFHKYINPLDNQLFRITSFENKRIREPENYFDTIFLTGIEILSYTLKTEILDSFEINIIKLIDEIKRVAKTNALIIIPTYAEFSNQSHFMLQSIEKLLSETGIYNPLGLNKMKDFFASINLDPKFFEQDGIIFATYQK